MFVILVYDVNTKRVARVLRKCREYLYWIQNSVFEGEITAGKLRQLKRELATIINEKEDSVIIFEFRSLKYARREILGVEKGGEEIVL